MHWEEPFLFFNILLLCSFQTSQIRKLGAKAQALLTISLSEKLFLHFFKVFVILPMSLSVYPNIEAIHFHNVDVKGQRFRRWSIVSS